MADDAPVMKQEVQLVLADEKGGAAMLATGFLAFGFAAGAICGASEHEGISSTLLTSLFTFIGGAVLGFAGFRSRAAPGAELVLSGRRIGAALTAFSLGVLLGVGAGSFARWQVHQHTAGATQAQGKTAGATQTPDKAPDHYIILHSGEENALRTIRDKLSRGAYESEAGCQEAVERLRWLVGRIN